MTVTARDVLRWRLDNLTPEETVERIHAMEALPDPFWGAVRVLHDRAMELGLQGHDEACGADDCHIEEALLERIR